MMRTMVVTSAVRWVVGVEAPEGGVARIAQPRGQPIVTDSSTALMLKMQIVAKLLTTTAMRAEERVVVSL